jgi:hypothetical protein
MIVSTPSASKIEASTAVGSKPMKTTGGKGPRLNRPTPEARRLATVILEVMAGARLTTDAAKALSVSLPRYYLLESRALNGLIAACEPRPKGRIRSAQSELVETKRKVQRLEQECSRYGALLRAAQRTVGLPAPQIQKPKDGATGKKGRKRKPTVRALKALDVLKSQLSGETEAGSAGEQPAKG